jgi:hypothetical protein
MISPRSEIAVAECACRIVDVHYRSAAWAQIAAMLTICLNALLFVKKK